MKLIKFTGNTPAYKITETNYSKDGKGPLVGKTLKLIGKLVNEDKSVAAYLYRDETNIDWMLECSASGKIKVIGEAYRIYYNQDCGHWNTLPGQKEGVLRVVNFQEVK